MIVIYPSTYSLWQYISFYFHALNQKALKLFAFKIRSTQLLRAGGLEGGTTHDKGTTSEWMPVIWNKSIFSPYKINSLRKSLILFHSPSSLNFGSIRTLYDGRSLLPRLSFVLKRKRLSHKFKSLCSTQYKTKQMCRKPNTETIWKAFQLYRCSGIWLKYIHSCTAFQKMSNEEKFPARQCSDTQCESFTYFFPLPCCSKTTTLFLASLHTFNAGTYRGGTEGPLPPTKKVMADRLWILYFLTIPGSLLCCSKFSLVCRRAQKKLIESWVAKNSSHSQSAMKTFSPVLSDSKEQSLLAMRKRSLSPVASVQLLLSRFCFRVRESGCRSL